MSRRGRAVMPWGKYKGVRVNNLPDDYISWLTTFPGFSEVKWKWLRDSIEKELNARGMKADFVPDEIAVEPSGVAVVTARRINLENE